MAADGREYVLKISAPSTEQATVDLATSALLHIAHADPSLTVPRVVMDKAGQANPVFAFADGTFRVVSMLTYLPGQPMQTVETGQLQRVELGRLAAHIRRALRNFRHAAGDRDLRWDVKRASGCVPLLSFVKDTGQRRLAELALANFEQHARPRFAELHQQIIHGDLNPHNVLVSPENHLRLAGVIDFGDTVHTFSINELAVAASYQAQGKGDLLVDPLSQVGDLVRGYNAVQPIEMVELDVLFDLVVARLAMILIISEWRATLHPENRDYVTRNSFVAWRGLESLARVTREEAQAYFRCLCDMEQ